MLHKVATKNEILEGSMKQIKVVGKQILLANVGGEIFAINDICTHEECSLSTGYLDGSTVYCPCHGSQFDVTTGAVTSPPASFAEPIYPVKIEGEDVFIEI